MQFAQPIRRFPSAERTGVRCRVEFEHTEDAGYPGEGVGRLTETCRQFDAEQYQGELHPLGVYIRVVQRGGDVWIGIVLFDKGVDTVERAVQAPPYRRTASN